MSKKKDEKPKVNPNPNDVPATPSCGGTFRKGGAADCDDSLGNPARHHGEASQAVVVSGRGPAAAAKQHTTGRRTGINAKTENEFAKESDTEDINPVERSTHKV